MPQDTLHTIYMAANLLGVHCNGCGHRAVLRAAALPKLENNMTLLRSLKFRCEKCGLHGTGKRKFTLSIPLDADEAEAFLQGRYIKGRKARM
jgi:hypothetical protein